MKHTAVVRGACLAVVLGLAGSVADAQTITIVDLGTLGGTYSVAQAVNKSGDVVGSSSPAPPSLTLHATLWRGGDPASIQDLGTLCGLDCPGAASNAWDINDAGKVVGESDDGTGTTVGFIWTADTGMQPLPPLPGDLASHAYGINNLGQVVGTSQGPAGVVRAVIWAGGAPSDLGSVGLPAAGQIMRVWDINDSGQIVGYYMLPGLVERAFLYASGFFTDIDPGGCGRSTAWDINVWGQIAGTASELPGCIYKAVRWLTPSSSGVVVLGALPAPVPQSGATGINDAGDVVGASDNGACYEPVLFVQGLLIKLGGLPPPPGGCRNHGQANAINKDRVIVGTSLAPSGDWHAVLWKVFF